MCIGKPMSGKTTAIKTLVASLMQLHQEELAEKTILFQEKKAEMLEIAVKNVNGQIVPKNSDPALEAKLKVRPEELQLIIDVCQFKGVHNFVCSPKAVTIH